MIDGWSVVALALGYVGILFAIAWFGDRRLRVRKGGDGRPLIFALSIAVYCTSWTFFGSVGLAAKTGYDFLPVYLGPILLFVFGWRFLQRIVRLAKSQNITSIADFLAARYGKSQAVAAIVAVIAVIGSLPYFALQLKAVAISVETLLGPRPLAELNFATDTALIIAFAMAVFAMLFGTRHIDATEHQEGLMLAIAAESLVKLAAFLIVGLFVVYAMFGGFGDLLSKARQSPEIQAIFAQGFNGSTWLTVTLLSFAAIILLPRQFHVTVVENNSENEIRRAAWLFPVYLILINLFVVPIAAAGILLAPPGSANADSYVLALPLSSGSTFMTMLAFAGGLSAATAMVIVDSVALAIMVCNGLFVPLLLKHRFAGAIPTADISATLLAIRRAAIFVIVMLGYAFYRLLGSTQGLASIGLVSFAAFAQFAPAFFGGLIWRQATARGAIAGMLTGFAVWGYTLLWPWFVKAGFWPIEILSEGPFGVSFLAPQSLFYLRFDPLSHGVFWSLAANTLAFVTVSLSRRPEPVERLQAHIFVKEEPVAAPASRAFRLWRTTITVDDLQRTVARYLGAERAERSFTEYAASSGRELSSGAEADIHLLRFSEHLLASAIGAASSRLVMSLLLQRNTAGSQSAMRLLDDATEALQYNRDLLQSALDQVRHGLSVFDKDMRLICWNRQFRDLLDLPQDAGRVGVPLDVILRTCAERGDFGPGTPDRLVADRLEKLMVRQETFQEHLRSSGRILELRTSAMPQGGIVTTYSDITERVAASEQLARANETLERRVRERTAELLQVNAALEAAKSRADDANLDKTRFLAAASHDVLQPLNAARLYAASLMERPLALPEKQITQNLDASLDAVEDILGALIEIARLDTGRLEPDITEFALQGLFDQIAVDFEPMAREKSLQLKFLKTSVWVRSDRRLLRRVVQNLVSNGIKYTTAGKVVVGVRRRRTEIAVQVGDTGPGIPAAQQNLIFKEFHRLEETAHTVRGLGLGLSIVDRIGKILEHPVAVGSKHGKGALFSVKIPRTESRIAPPAPQIVAPGAQISGLMTLCIDNEPAVLEGMELLLQGWGCDVLKAQSAAAALDVIGASLRPPDIILADYHLDSGTGLDAIAAIRARLGRDVPAIMITADRTSEVQRDVRMQGITMLRKPIKAAALRATITQLTIQQRAAAE
jgi:Na+/proline symporter/signal transduction histidine kinase/ActR/RegA family two-component response regulator